MLASDAMSDAAGQAAVLPRQSSITGGTGMLAVCLPMCSTVDIMARGGDGSITGNDQGQALSSYSPHLTVFRGSCPTTVGRTAGGTAATNGTHIGAPEAPWTWVRGVVCQLCPLHVS